MATILIFGGAAGSGGAACRGLLARGENVVMVDCGEAAASLAANCSGARLPGTLALVDAAPDEAGACDKAIAVCDERFGSLDGVAINLNRSVSQPLEDWSPEAFDAELGFSLRMPFLIAQAAATVMAAACGGAIVLTSSTAALRGGAGKAPFHAAKAGLVGLCSGLAAELAGNNVRVNCILPGWINSAFGRSGALTDFVPLRRLGLVDEVADAIMFLVSTASAPMNGVALVVDGGATAV